MCYVEYSSNSTDHGSKELPTIMKTAVQVLKYYLQISYIDLFSDLFLNKLAHKELMLVHSECIVIVTKYRLIQNTCGKCNDLG